MHPRPAPGHGAFELRGPLRLLAHDAVGIHQPSRDAGARLAKDVDAADDRRAQPLRVTGRRTSARSSRPCEADQVERVQPERVGKREQVVDQQSRS